MCAVKLKKEMHPAIVLILLIGVSATACAVIYFGLPGTSFHGIRTGIFFPFKAEFDDVRFMDNQIKCDSNEATTKVRNDLQKIKSDYPIEMATVTLSNYSSGYKFHVTYATYFGQHFSFSGEKFFRRGMQVGESTIDLELKTKDAELEQTIRNAIEAYFRSKEPLK